MTEFRNRRSFLLGLAAGLAPAIIRIPGLLMPVRALVMGTVPLVPVLQPENHNWMVFNGDKWLDSSHPEAKLFDVADRSYRWVSPKNSLEFPREFSRVSVSDAPCEEDPILVPSPSRKRV